jgi:predicted nucleotidyltransferase
VPASPDRELEAPPVDTILLVEVGSTAHGTGLPGGEDRDEMAIFIESPTVVIGPSEYEARGWMIRSQPDGVPSGPGDTDRIVYSLRRYLRLALAGNPSVLLALWAPIFRVTTEGNELRALRGAFIGRHLVGRYRGYMKAQRDRLEGRRGGRHGQLREDAAGYDTKYAMHAARLGMQGIELLQSGGLSLPIGGDDGDWLRAVRRGEIDLGTVLGRITELDARLAALSDDESLPSGPDIGAVTVWSVRAHLSHWRNEERSQSFG